MRPVQAEAMPPAAEGKQPVLAEVAQHLAVRAAVRKETAAAELEKKTEKVAADQRTATAEGWKKWTTCQSAAAWSRSVSPATMRREEGR